MIRPVDLPRRVAYEIVGVDDRATNQFAREESALLTPQSVPARVRSFQLGREAAHRALHRLDLDDRPVLIGDHREPVWPPGTTGSISHTAQLGVALVGRRDEAGGIGVDIEERRYAPELWDQVPRAEERPWLNQAVSPDNSVLALFSAKESIFKAFFPRVGGFFGFEAASLTPTEGGFRARLVADLDREYPEHRTFFVGCRWAGDLVLTWVVLPSPGPSRNITTKSELR